MYVRSFDSCDLEFPDLLNSSSPANIISGPECQSLEFPLFFYSGTWGNNQCFPCDSSPNQFTPEVGVTATLGHYNPLQITGHASDGTAKGEKTRPQLHMCQRMPSHLQLMFFSQLLNTNYHGQQQHNPSE